MLSAIEFFFVIVVPTCSVASLLSHWIRMSAAAGSDFETVTNMRRATRDMAARLDNLELLLEDDGISKNPRKDPT
jgi:hypothetical protein